MKYEVKVFKFKDIEGKLIKPTFQRNFIWSKAKKLSFVQSIKMNYPIGTILLSPKLNGKYLLIDGLQRISTLNEIKRDPFEYISESEVNLDLLIRHLVDINIEIKNNFNNLRSEVQATFIDKIRRIIIEGLKSGKTLKLKNTRIATDISRKLIENFAFLNSDGLLVSQGVNEIIAHLTELFNVDELEIPTIIFFGPENELSEVFQTLNSGGVKLSKYDIFAASWTSSEIFVTKNSGLIEIIIDKYNNSEIVEGIEIDGFDENQLRSSGTLNLFEYAFALSKALSKESKFLFTSKDISAVDSFGFNLLAALFDLRNKDMRDLEYKINKHKIDYSDLKEKIKECFNDIESNLGKWVKAIDQNKYYFEYKEFQVIAYIATLFKLKFRIDSTSIISIKHENSKFIHNFLNNIHLNYLYDILKNDWGNAGDSKLDELVLNDVKNSKLIYKPEPDNFELLFNQWLIDSNRSQVIPIKTTTKMVLNYLIKFKINSNHLKNDTKLNFDHIIPQNRLKFFEKSFNNYPISTICNLTIIPEYGNKAKRDKSYYEWIDGNNEPFKIDDEKLLRHLYPKREEISFISNKETFTLENYLGFLENRKNTLLNEFIKFINCF